MKKILIISICIVLVVVSNVWNVKASISEDKEKIKAAVFFTMKTMTITLL